MCMIIPSKFECDEKRSATMSDGISFIVFHRCLNAMKSGVQLVKYA